MKITNLLLVLLFLNPALFSQPVFLRTGAIQPKANITMEGIDSFAKSNPRFGNQSFAVIQFEHLPTTGEKAQLAEGGINLLDYLPQNAYTVSIRTTPTAQLLKAAKATAIFQLSPEQKMQSYFAKGLIPSWAVKIAGTVDVWVSFYPTLEAGPVLTALEKLGVDIVATNNLAYRVLALRIAAGRIREIAALPFVEFIQPAPPKDQPLNYNSRVGARANVLQAGVANGGRGLTGEGVTIGHGDNADVQAHADFNGRLINRNASPFNAHGVHTAGTMAGAGNINELYKGYAPKATVLSQSFSSILDNAPNYVQEYGMVITNNSYGNIIECDYHGTYDLSSRILDQQALDLPSLLHVFSAGNSGAGTCFPYPQGYRTVLGGYQAAKNIVTVGATTDSGTLAGFSSRGPLLDGRIKPEITAMGQGVISAWPTNVYAVNNGTSMSAPAVSGGLALLYQRYRQLNGGANPKNGLMKALLCNGGMDRGPAGPDFSYGFGWMNLLRSVEALEAKTYFQGNSINGGITTHNMTVPANTAQLKILLYWNDLPASVISTKNLVNDLDLEVVDPSGAVVLPKILDTSLTALATVAVNGIDRVNNLEQVIINTPQAGNYTVRIKGSTVTNQQQEYFVVYDPVPVQLKLTSPAGGEGLVPGETAKISWDSYGLTGNGTLEFSPDGGTSWTTIAGTVDVNRVVYTWTVPAIATNNALVRITKSVSGETSVSDPFTIVGQPVVSLSPVQCEDYISINWTAIQGTTDYEVMLLRGDEMKTIAITANTSYTFSGLSRDTTYFVTVRARINGQPGRRALAVSRLPVSGTCAGTISDNDVKLDAILSPRSGRKETSSALTAAEIISIRVKNLDDAPLSNIIVSYSINGNAPVSETIPANIAPGGTLVYNFVQAADLSATGIYRLKTFVKISNDLNPANDTASLVIKHIENLPLNLATYFTDNLEAAVPATYERDTLGLTGVERYDYLRGTGFGRLRTYVNSGIAASGTKAFTLDVSRYQPAGNVQYLEGTFNLKNYTTVSNDIRLDFLYRHHGQLSNTANRVWIRGSDTEPWIMAYNLDSIDVQEGAYTRVESIEVSSLLAVNGQTFTTSFGVRWGQWGQWPATDAENAAGYTIDDIRLYQVFNDVKLVQIDAPAVNGCGLSANDHITVSIRNTTNTTLTNVPVRYRINGGAVVSETVTSIAPNATVQYTFTAGAGFNNAGPYTILAYADLPADSFRENDSTLLTVYNQPLITTFPYLENFEAGNGNFYAGGRRSSWEYGTPESRKIKGAASGSRAWKTRLQGTYNDREFSYLYSPCFDISGMTVPTLSFSVALDIEDCGAALCDAAWVEYSADGQTWQKLTATGSGTNWYNRPAPRNIWSIQNYTWWHVATQPLPTGLARLRLRFVLATDAGLAREGIAIDDIHIYDNGNGIYDGPSMTAPVTHNVSGNDWTHFTSGGKLVASVKPSGQNLGATAVQAFPVNGAARFTNNRYYVNRNITIKPTNSPTDSVLVRFYFLDREIDSVIKATACPACSKPASAYELGVSQYSDPDKAVENGDLLDNQQGLWRFIPPAGVAMVPFDKGYYAEYKVAGFSEFWLNRGGPDLQPLPVKLMNITAVKQGNNVAVRWTVGSESNITRYEIEVARGNDALQSSRFDKIGEVASSGNTTATRQYNFTDAEPDKLGARYYRLKNVNADGSFRYSPVRAVVFEEGVLWQVYPNPSKGEFSLVYQLTTNEIFAADLYDAGGRLVKQYRSAATGFLQKLNIDIAANNYATGVYLLRVKTSGNEKFFKLYKQK